MDPLLEISLPQIKRNLLKDSHIWSLVHIWLTELDQWLTWFLQWSIESIDLPTWRRMVGTISSSMWSCRRNTNAMASPIPTSRLSWKPRLNCKRARIGLAKYFQLKNTKHVKIRWDLGCKKCSSLSSKTLNGVFPQGAHSALGMSAVLARAAASTHEILDSHRHNSSLEAGQMAFSFPQDLGSPGCRRPFTKSSTSGAPFAGMRTSSPVTKTTFGIFTMLRTDKPWHWCRQVGYSLTGIFW